MTARALLMAASVGVVALASCSRPSDPLLLEGNWLTIENATADRWSDIEVWVNSYYRYTIPYVEPGGRFKVALDSFVAAYGQRFDVKRAPVTGMRLTARLQDGTTHELTMQPPKSGLAGALEGLGGKQ